MYLTLKGTPHIFLFNFRVSRLPVGDGQSIQKFVGGACDER
jgi:hypothetical protein